MGKKLQVEKVSEKDVYKWYKVFEEIYELHPTNDSRIVFLGRYEKIRPLIRIYIGCRISRELADSIFDICDKYNLDVEFQPECILIEEKEV